VPAALATGRAPARRRADAATHHDAAGADHLETTPAPGLLVLSWEIEVFGVLRTALSARPPGEDSALDGGPRA
jgi:hypothetical protein